VLKAGWRHLGSRIGEELAGKSGEDCFGDAPRARSRSAAAPEAAMTVPRRGGLFRQLFCRVLARAFQALRSWFFWVFQRTRQNGAGD
jgi:hypothetical protein